MARDHWATVYAVLARAVSASEPYDLEGALLVLHSMESNPAVGPVVGSRAANLRHLTAIMDGGSRCGGEARRAMAGVASELERLSRRHG